MAVLIALCRFEVYEDALVSSEVGTVTANDADSGAFGKVVYSISDNDKSVPLSHTVPTPHNSPRRFTINSTTGRISTKAGLDREQLSSVTVTITATDQDPVLAARRSQAVQTTITGRISESEGLQFYVPMLAVLDVNDNSPEFSSDEYEVSLTENTDTVAFSVSANDLDSGINAEITYELVNGNTNNAFVIGRSTTPHDVCMHLFLPPQTL